MQTGVQRDRAERGCQAVRRRLPITPGILRQVRSLWNARADDPDVVIVWAAATLRFFGLFRAGGLTVPSRAVYNQHVHLSWGDVTVNHRNTPSMLRIHLKCSKCDQLGRGVDVVVGQMMDHLCPVSVVPSYMALRGGGSAWPFLCVPGRLPLTKARFVAHLRLALTQAGIPCQDYSEHSLQRGAGGPGRARGFYDPVSGKVEQPSLHSDPKGATGAGGTSALTDLTLPELVVFPTGQDLLAGHCRTCL